MSSAVDQLFLKDNWVYLVEWISIVMFINIYILKEEKWYYVIWINESNIKIILMGAGRPEEGRLSLHLQQKRQI